MIPNGEVFLSIYYIWIILCASKIRSLSVVSLYDHASACKTNFGKEKKRKSGFHSKGVPCATTLKYTCRLEHPWYKRVIFLNVVFGAL
jgi:hypothetical protein